MRKLLASVALALALATPAIAETADILGTPLVNSSGVQANANAVATLGGVANKITYIGGFSCGALGATAALNVNLTVTGLLGGTLTWPFNFPTGATVPATPLTISFAQPMPASGTNTAIVVTLPAGGAGNTSAVCNAWGVQR